jgi:hypothetical protein
MSPTSEANGEAKCLRGERRWKNTLPLSSDAFACIYRQSNPISRPAHFLPVVWRGAKLARDPPVWHGGAGRWSATIGRGGDTRPRAAAAAAGAWHGLAGETEPHTSSSVASERSSSAAARSRDMSEPPMCVGVPSPSSIMESESASRLLSGFC